MLHHLYLLIFSVVVQPITMYKNYCSSCILCVLIINLYCIYFAIIFGIVIFMCYRGGAFQVARQQHRVTESHWPVGCKSLLLPERPQRLYPYNTNLYCISIRQMCRVTWNMFHSTSHKRSLSSPEHDSHVILYP